MLSIEIKSRFVFMPSKTKKLRKLITQSYLEYLESRDPSIFITNVNNAISSPYSSSVRYRVYNAKFNYKSNTSGQLLHYLCEYLSTEESAEIIESYLNCFVDDDYYFREELGFDIDGEDSEGRTALHIAIKNNHYELAKLLISYGASLSDKNNHGETPIDIARKINDNNMLSFLVFECKAYKKELKSDIISNGNLNGIEIDSYTGLLTVPKIIESSMYIENDSIKKQINGEIAVLYRNQLLKPLLDMAALEVLGDDRVRKEEKSDNEKLILKLESDKKNADQEKLKFITEQIAYAQTKPLPDIKNFKIIVVDGDDILAINPLVKDAFGYYAPNSYSVFIAGNDSRLPREILSTVLHEMSHFIADILFQNKSRPFADGHSNQEMWQSVVEVTKKRYTQDVQNIIDYNSIQAWDAIGSVYEAYEESEYSRELFVRVPQILVLLGKKVGIEWLRNNTPELLNAYSLVLQCVEEFKNENNFESKVNNAKTPIFACNKNPLFNNVSTTTNSSFVTAITGESPKLG